MNRIKRFSNELLSKYPNQFTVNFDENKKMISDMATVRSKILRNKVAGYITSKLRKESDKEKNQQKDNQTDDELN